MRGSNANESSSSSLSSVFFLINLNERASDFTASSLMLERVSCTSNVNASPRSRIVSRGS